MKILFITFPKKTTLHGLILRLKNCEPHSHRETNRLLLYHDCEKVKKDLKTNFITSPACMQSNFFGERGGDEILALSGVKGLTISR